MIGAFRGDKSGVAVTGAAAVSLLAAAVLVWLDSGKIGAVFHDMFAVDDFRRFVKIMLLVAGAGSLALAPAFFARGEGGHKPEYPVLVMLAVLGMMLMVSANDWIALYVGL
ncbi:MAG TPA: hypothetical protein DCY07_00555 [Rhodospirillaceae bacterium]|nr:hypothetical protein [Rhodospirillaceae bacterium]